MYVLHDFHIFGHIRHRIGTKQSNTKEISVKSPLTCHSSFIFGQQRKVLSRFPNDNRHKKTILALLGKHFPVHSMHQAPADVQAQPAALHMIGVAATVKGIKDVHQLRLRNTAARVDN